ncbi:DUF4926 domain-containing protein [Altericista sp. CCNU0014]|uniref:DUF4926 domain-containing protein n=1 Tax=Altericista sp. CCNU0014 TaxID=3082949 RepID=UPI003851456A
MAIAVLAEVGDRITLKSRSGNKKDMVALLDVVALAEDLPEQGLLRGQVGSVVEALAPETFLIEFSDDRGRTYAMLPLKACQLIVLHFEAAGLQLASV